VLLCDHLTAIIFRLWITNVAKSFK